MRLLLSGEEMWGGSVLFLDHLSWKAHPTVSGGAAENWITASEQSAFHMLNPQIVYELGTDWKKTNVSLCMETLWKMYPFPMSLT